jgi:ACS family glucarate transporter-like MFS transporter
MSVEPTAERTTRVRIYLSIWLFVLSSVAFMDRGNISVAGLQIMKDFGLGPTRLGTISSAFLIGYAACQLPAGWLAARYGPRKVLTAGIFLWAIATGATALLPPGMGNALLILLSLRFLLGVGESVMYPSSNQFVARWIPTEERGKINGLIFAGVGAGQGLTPVLVTWLILHHGWPAAFFLSASLFIVGGIVWFAISRDTPQEHPLVSPAELRMIEEGIGTDPRHPAATTTEMPTVGKPPMRHPIAWRAIFHRRDLLALMGSYFCFGYISWIFFAWFYIYMATARGLNLKQSAINTMLPPLAMMVCAFVGGFVSDKLTRSHGLRVGRCGPGVFAMLLAAGLLLLGAHVASATLATIFLAGGAGALYLAQSSYWSASADIAGRSSGVFSGLVNMGAQLGGALTAWLTPKIALQFGWMTAFAVAAGMAVVGALCWMTVHPEHPLEL